MRADRCDRLVTYRIRHFFSFVKGASVTERVVLHCDLNNFYASVECMLKPELANLPVAVCGSVEDRHGIVLAKNYIAKKYGIVTAEPVWQAKKKCPNLVIVPPHFENYMLYSHLTRSIYERYTDQVEPFGIDECWLDVTGSSRLFGQGEKIAEEIRKSVKSELGITISAGVSFNKIFAKMGSDLKKPDAVTVIGKDTYKEQLWSLPAYEMLGCGRQTWNRLNKLSINTIGDIAKTPVEALEQMLGVGGRHLWCFANGLDSAPVMKCGYESPVKSIGRGITCVSNLQNLSEVWLVLLELSQKVGYLMRQEGFKAQGLSVCMKDSRLCYFEKQRQFKMATDSSFALANSAKEMFVQTYKWDNPVRALTVRAINLVSAGMPEQLDLFFDYLRYNRQCKMERTVDCINDRYGTRAVIPASLLKDSKIPHHSSDEDSLPSFNFI